MHVEEAALLVLGERFHKSSQGPEKIKEKVQKAVSDIAEDKKQGTGQNQQNSSEGKKRGMALL